MNAARVSRRRFGAAAAAFASAAFVRTTAKAAQFEFKCSSELSVEHPTSIRLTQMWAAIEQESGGRIHTQFFPNSQLGAPAAAFAQARAGAIQFDLLSAGNLSAVVPSFDACNLGFAFKDVDEALRAMDGPLGDYLRAQATEKGLYVLKKFWDAGMFQIGSGTHPIKTPDDLRGFKIRVPESKIVIDLFKGLGANPTPIPYNEVYSGLQTKIIDGLAAPLLAIETMHFYEVQKYITITNHAWASEILIANGDAWKSLPADLQALVERNHTKYCQMEREDAKAANASLAAKLATQGISMTPVDQAPFREHLGTYYQTWSAALGPRIWALLQTAIGRKLG